MMINLNNQSLSPDSTKAISIVTNIPMGKSDGNAEIYYFGEAGMLKGEMIVQSFQQCRRNGMSFYLLALFFPPSSYNSHQTSHIYLHRQKEMSCVSLQLLMVAWVRVLCGLTCGIPPGIVGIHLLTSHYQFYDVGWREDHIAFIPTEVYTMHPFFIIYLIRNSIPVWRSMT